MKRTGIIALLAAGCCLVLMLLPGAAAAQTNPGVVTVCTFNIQVFGKSKLGNPDYMNVLTSVIRKYDIVAVQEIKDKSYTVPGAFLAKINGPGQYHYEYLCSERTGKQPDDKESEEQYAFYYNADRVSMAGEPSLYDDTQHDFFAREPYAARFKTKKGNFTFVLVTIHTDPDLAVKEIGSLDEVVKWAKRKYHNEKEIIVLGDFNASCTYAKPADLDKLAFRGAGYQWIVPDTANTNLAAEDCAYDRLVMTAATKPYFTGNWGVDQSFTDKRVSDHWPVWAEFKNKK